jgi:hypothetical protein
VIFLHTPLTLLKVVGIWIVLRGKGFDLVKQKASNVDSDNYQIKKKRVHSACLLFFLFYSTLFFHPPPPPSFLLLFVYSCLLCSRTRQHTFLQYTPFQQSISLPFFLPVTAVTNQPCCVIKKRYSTLLYPSPMLFPTPFWAEFGMAGLEVHFHPLEIKKASLFYSLLTLSSFAYFFIQISYSTLLLKRYLDSLNTSLTHLHPFIPSYLCGRYTIHHPTQHRPLSIDSFLLHSTFPPLSWILSTIMPSPTNPAPSSSSSSHNVVGVHYKVGKKIGEGSFGVIYEGKPATI